MDDRIVRLSGGKIPGSLVERAAGLVRDGAVLVHPTATIHGYGCCYDNARAVERIRRLKGRDGGKPMIVLVRSAEWLEGICSAIPAEALALAGKFWPGPVTLVLKASEVFRRASSWPVETVAVRHCAHPFATALLDRLDIPFVSTSLNISGEPFPDDSAEFVARLYADHDRWPEPPELAVIDPELDRPGRAASAIVDMSTPGVFRLLRAGSVPTEELERAGDFSFERE